MALPARPDVVDLNGQRTYHSLDATDQAFYDNLSHVTLKRKFVEMIHRWRDGGATLALSDGNAIVNRYKSHGCRLRKTFAQVVPQAVAPLVAPPVSLATPAPLAPFIPLAPPIPPAPPAVSSPPQSPLAERSPRLVCQGDDDHLLSPTKGQADFVVANLNDSWRFADVIHQIEPSHLPNRRPLAPTTSVCLFVRPNDNGRIVDQVAVKCLDIDELGGCEDQTLNTARSTVQGEVNVNQLVSSTQCSHVTRYRGHGVRNWDDHIAKAKGGGAYTLNRQDVLIYQDFARCGDLKTLIENHRGEKRPIPEHFIWYTLRELTEALIALYEGPGKCSKPHEPALEIPTSDEFPAPSAKPWLSILHLDIKTQNVFLEANNADYPGYPKPVLADFGVSIQGTPDVIDGLKPDDPLHNHARFAGTDGWHPPERSKVALDHSDYGSTLDPEYTPYTWQLTEKSDVWALGLVVHKMMYAHCNEMAASTLSNESKWNAKLNAKLHEGKINPYQSHFRISNVEEVDIEHIPSGHSARLCLLAERCLRHDPDKRPKLESILNVCQGELTRLDDMPGASAGKRKRSDADESDNEPTLLTGKEGWYDKFDKYRPRENYQPKRQRTRLDLGDDHPQRAAYIQLVIEWSNLPRPTTEAQDDAIDAINKYLLDFDDGQPMSDEDDQEYQWAARHLISSLRKRNNKRKGAYILTGRHIEEYRDGWLETAWQPPIKIEILEYLLTSADFWEDFTEEQASQDAIAALKNAMQWGLMMLRDIRTPAEEDIMREDVGSHPAEPREPRMENQSALHKGIYDWIFVKPTGAYYKD